MTATALKEIKLNLGGRDSRIPGFLNVDLYESPNTDVVTDCADLHTFETASVAEIYASNILEHFSHRKTLDVLKEWKRVLVPRGTLWLSVPDFDEVVRLYAQMGFVDYLRNLLYGEQEYPLAFHYTIFTYPTLAAICCEAGFSDIKRHKFLPFEHPDCSRLLNNMDFKPQCLNVEVIK